MIINGYKSKKLKIQISITKFLPKNFYIVASPRTEERSFKHPGAHKNVFELI